MVSVIYATEETVSVYVCITLKGISKLLVNTKEWNSSEVVKFPLDKKYYSEVNAI